MTLSTDVRLARKVAAACGSVALLLGAAACGNGGNPGNDKQPEPQTQRGGPDARMPGATGKVAAVADSTAQVQGMDGQVAVSWTSSTTFTKEVSAKLADVKVGDCVLVTSEDQAASSDSTPATSVTAASVRAIPKTNGSCSPGGGGAGGPGGSGGGPQLNGPQLNGTPPEGAPAGGARPQVRAFGGAVGEVTAVTGSGFTVSSTRPGSDSTTAVVVAVDAKTTYTATAKGAASDVKVGVCVAAEGATDATGAVTARTIAVSTPQGGECGGFMRFRSSDGPSTQGS